MDVTSMQLLSEIEAIKKSDYRERTSKEQKMINLYNNREDIENEIKVKTFEYAEKNKIDYDDYLPEE